MVIKRGNIWYAYFAPFGNKIGVRLPSVKFKPEAKLVEAKMINACRTGNYEELDPITREVILKMFKNQGWSLPVGLTGKNEPAKELTLMEASKIFKDYPDNIIKKSWWRHKYALLNILEKLGKDTPVKSIWVPNLKTYQVQRLDEGGAPATINRELSTLSKLYSVLIELQHVETNPVALVRCLSTKASVREVYLSLTDVEKIAQKCPDWFQPIVWVSFFTGLRMGEILSITRSQVNLHKRIIRIHPDQTKEGNAKRVPISKDLSPILQKVLRVTFLVDGPVFFIPDIRGGRSIGRETAKNCWPRACKSLGLEKPWPRFHDLRHSWRANARRSGVDPAVAESIMGHWFRRKTVNEMYGRISDEELVDAIDRMNFNHGQTEIYAPAAFNRSSQKKGNKIATNDRTRKNRSCGDMT